jgi:hypothetical protein
MISGAVQAGVPTAVIAWSSSFRTTESPKSATFALRLLSTSMLRACNDVRKMGDAQSAAMRVNQNRTSELLPHLQIPLHHFALSMEVIHAASNIQRKPENEGRRNPDSMGCAFLQEVMQAAVLAVLQNQA